MKKLKLFVTIIIIGAILTFVLSYVKGFHNGKLLITKYHCSDVCPNQGAWYTIYWGINSKQECQEIDGKVINDSWLNYIGCSPK